jgi:hypothetical protein
MQNAGGRRRKHVGFWWKVQKERDHQEDLDVCGRIALKWILEKWDGGVWVGFMAQDRGQWRAVVSTVMNLRLP